MKLGEVRRMTWERMDALTQRKNHLNKLLEDSQAGGSRYDRVELSNALDCVEDEYKQVSALSAQLAMMDANLQNAESAKQQAEATAESFKELLKIMEVFRRIAKGAKVPPEDERKLMEYNPEMYMMAKRLAMMCQSDEEYDSLWADEEPQETPPDPAEVAAGKEVGNPLSGIPSSAGAVAEAVGGE